MDRPGVECRVPRARLHRVARKGDARGNPLPQAAAPQAQAAAEAVLMECPIVVPEADTRLMDSDPLAAQVLARVFADLTIRERYIILSRYGCDLTQEEVSDELGVSRNRVYQIERRALRLFRHQRHWASAEEKRADALARQAAELARQVVARKRAWNRACAAEEWDRARAAARDVARARADVLRQPPTEREREAARVAAEMLWDPPHA